MATMKAQTIVSPQPANTTPTDNLKLYARGMSPRRSTRKRASPTQPPLQVIPVKGNRGQKRTTNRKLRPAPIPSRCLGIQPSSMTPAQVVLLEAKRMVAVSNGNLGIMDIILDAMAPNIEEEEQLSDSRRRFRVREPQRYFFIDFASLDLYWEEQSAFLLGVAGRDEEDWSGLITLANVSAERSTVAWSDESGTSRSVSVTGSDI